MPGISDQQLVPRVNDKLVSRVSNRQPIPEVNDRQLVLGINNQQPGQTLFHI